MANVTHQCLTETIQTKLGSVISGSTFDCILPGQAANVDDVAATALTHQGHRLVTTIIDAIQICLDHREPFLGSEVCYIPHNSDTGVVDQNVNAKKSLDGQSEQRFYVQVISDRSEERRV